jgi:DNA modification methylase
MQIEEIEIERVIPYARNPRKNEAAVAKTAASIKEFGWRQPIVVDKEYVIIAGHTRLQAAKQLDLKKVPIHIADDLTEAQVKAYRIADNRVGEEADWDYELLKLEIEELDDLDLDLSLLGFDSGELEEIMIDPDELEAIPSEEDDEIPEAVEPICQKGDVWHLGEHRLLCGDATVFADYEKILNGELIDLVITDPPYNVDYVGKTKEALKIQNDKMSQSEFFSFLSEVYANLYASMKDGAPVYVFHADSEGDNFRKAMKEAGLKLAQCLVWEKNVMVMGRQDYHWKHEPVLYGWKEGDAHKWYSDRKQTTVLSFDRPVRNIEHPTMKPVEILCYLLGNSSKKGDLVWDSFLGSGSTLIACEKMKRRCYGLELDPKYCDVIIKRWEDYTGKKAERMVLDGAVR